MTGEKEDSWKINSSIITGKGMITLIVQIYMMADELHLVELRRGKVMGPTLFPLFGVVEFWNSGIVERYLWVGLIIRDIVHEPTVDVRFEMQGDNLEYHKLFEDVVSKLHGVLTLAK
jgi:hypothetical protein